MQNLSTKGRLSNEKEGMRRGYQKKKGRRKCEEKDRRLNSLIKDQPCGGVSFALVGTGVSAGKLSSSWLGVPYCIHYFSSDYYQIPTRRNVKALFWLTT